MNTLLHMQSEGDDGVVDHFVMEWRKQLRELAYYSEDCIDLSLLHIRRCDTSGVASPRRVPNPMAKRAQSSSSSGSQLIPYRRRTKRPTRERDWYNLTDGPAGLIAERVLAGDVADYMRFRAVCTAWRQCSADPREHNSLDSRFHPRRWFMLREWPERAAPHRRRFINAATGQCVAVDLPEIEGHRSFGPTAEGLLVLVDDRTLFVRVLNPFTRRLTELPSLATLLPRDRYLVGGDLSVCGAGLAGGDGCLIALYFSNTRKLAVAKPGDERWALVDHRVPRLASSLSFAGRFYCVSDDADAVMTVKTSENQPPRLVAAAELAIQYSPMMDTLHLVDNIWRRADAGAPKAPLYIRELYHRRR
uniref:KIB1-4 beta-propeller domain-containing protein n=1 Tax=Oryza rufipogon TaxID=4529 RepID=A0A0E0P2E0_ORYRU